jgi:serine/threonine protein phosphatase PrpC
MGPENEIDTAEFAQDAGSSGTERPQPFSSLVQVDFGAISDVGKVRTNNEDHFRIARTSRTMRTLMSNLPPGQVPDYFEDVAYSMVVADGMGGEAAGEVASMMAITIGVNLRLNDVKWNLKINEQEARDLMDRACRMIHQIDEELAERARSDPALHRMGTTLTTTYSLGDDLFLFHVGDSRAYLCRGGRLRQLTRDHTVAQALADAGQIEAEEVASHRMRHCLTNVMGSQTGRLHVEMLQVRLLDGDRVLLCTDGLTEMAHEDEILEILRGIEGSGQACRAVVDLALQHGGKDNVTVLIARYRIPEHVDTEAAW